MPKAIPSKRVNVTLPETVILQISLLAEQDGVPMTTKAGQLIQQSIDLEEDRLLAEEADTRWKNSTPKDFISEEEFWEKAGV